MARSGWIRDWNGDRQAFFAGFNAAKQQGKDSDQQRHAGRQAERAFREEFTVDLMSAETGGTSLGQLAWGQSVELTNDDIPTSLTGHSEVQVDDDGQTITGWVKKSALAAEAFVDRPASDQSVLDDPKVLQVPLRNKASSSGKTLTNLLWGDPIQIIKRSGDWMRIATRGRQGWLHSDHVTDTGLLEVYFIDVGQGDGVLVRGPDGRHLLVDGGLPRTHQQTGKNAADFVDWKFFVDYGDLEVNLDAMIASHCDKDHYGGLDDLVSTSKTAIAELDTVGVNISTMFHAGLSYWGIDDAERTAFPDAPSSTKWLGPEVSWDGIGRDEFGSFRGSATLKPKIMTRLLDDSISVSDALDDDHHPHLAGDWQTFIGRCDKAGAESIEVVGLPFDATSTSKFLDGWDSGNSFSIRVLAPLTLSGPDGPALPDFGDTGQNTNGHSMLLRLDYGGARILLTGDLNKNSMHYVLRGYEGAEDELSCDVAKGCHHGSHDISLKFLEKVEAGATVISSGDSEGYGHPRPEVVGASAVTGFKSINETDDVLRTPLIYSTEVERGVSLGAVKHLGFSSYPVDAQFELDGTLFAKKPSQSDLKDLYDELVENETSAEFTYTYFKGVWTRKTGQKSLVRARVLDRVNYGLVNVRTDGGLIMCATQKDSGGGWTIHSFPARF